MQKCEVCKKQFSWNNIYQSFWWTYNPIECDRCGTTHQITIPGRFVFVSLTILPAVIFGSFLSPFSNVLVTLGFVILIPILGSLLIPFFVPFKKSL